MSALSISTSAVSPDVGQSPPSYLAPDLMVRGRIRCRGTVEIDAAMEGDIDANNLVVGPKGRLRAVIAANDTVISGTMEGIIKSRCVTFTDGCSFDGEVQYEALGMEAHADVRGTLFPILEGDARSALAEQAHHRRQTIRSHALSQRSPLAHSTGEHHTPVGDRVAHSPVRHTLLGVVAILLLAVAFGIGLMVVNPTVRDWRTSLVGSLVNPPATPAPDGTESVSRAVGTGEQTPNGPAKQSVTQDPVKVGAVETTSPAAQGEGRSVAPSNSVTAVDDAEVLLPPRKVVNGVLVPSEKPPVPTRDAVVTAVDTVSGEKAAAEKVAAEKAAAEKAAAEKVAAEKAAAEKAAAEKAAAEKVAAEKAAAEKAAAEKVAAEKAAAEKAAAEKVAAEKAAAEKAAAEKVAAEKAAAENVAAEKAAAEKIAAEKVAAEKIAAEKAAAEKIAAEKAAAEKAPAEKVAGTKPAAEKAASAKKPQGEKAIGAPRSNDAVSGDSCSWVLQCDGPGDSSCVSVRQCGGPQ